MLILHPPTGITILAMARHAAKIAKHRATLPDRYLHQLGWLRYDIDHAEALAIRVDAPSPDDLRFRAGVFGEAREGPGLLGFTMAGVPVTCISADGGIAKIAADMVAQHTALIDTTHSGLVFVGEHAWTKALAHTRETRSVAGGGPETLEFDVVLAAAAGEDPFDAPASKMAPSGPVSIREQGEWVTSLHGPHFAWSLESMTTTRTDEPGHVRATLTFKSSSTARELTPEEVESFLPAGASDDVDTCDTRQMIERAVLAVPGGPVVLEGLHDRGSCRLPCSERRRPVMSVRVPCPACGDGRVDALCAALATSDIATRNARVQLAAARLSLDAAQVHADTLREIMGQAMYRSGNRGCVTLTLDAATSERFDDAVLGLSSAIPFVARKVLRAAGEETP